MPDIAICPCGKQPSDLVICEGNGVKYAFVSGNCCGDWMIEFRTDYKEIDSDECKELARQAWNGATRSNRL